MSSTGHNGLPLIQPDGNGSVPRLALRAREAAAEAINLRNAGAHCATTSIRVRSTTYMRV